LYNQRFCIKYSTGQPNTLTSKVLHRNAKPRHTWVRPMHLLCRKFSCHEAVSVLLMFLVFFSASVYVVEHASSGLSSSALPCGLVSLQDWVDSKKCAMHVGTLCEISQKYVVPSAEKYKFLELLCCCTCLVTLLWCIRPYSNQGLDP
jgi:hypothetical protein